MVTPPVPFPDSSRFELDAFVDTVLSAIVTPSTTTEAVVVTVVNVPAAAVLAPIGVPSIAPPPMSASFITTFPVPFADISRSALDELVVMMLSIILTASTSNCPVIVSVPVTDTLPTVVTAAVVKADKSSTLPVPLAESCKLLFEAVVLIMLSVILILSSTVKLEALTTPVPPGVRLMSALEVDAMVLSLKVKLSIVVVPDNVAVLVTVKVESVVRPDGTPKVDERLTAPSKVAVPDTFIVPSTTSPSLMLTAVESSELMLVPANFKAPISTAPVPLAFIIKSSFDLVPVIWLSLIVTAGKTTAPVPPGVMFMSAFELEPIMLSLNVRLSIVVVPANDVVLVVVRVDNVVSPEGTDKVDSRVNAPDSVVAPVTFKVPSTISPSLILIVLESSELKLVPLIFIAPNTTEPVPFGNKFMLSLVLVPSMLLPLNLIAGSVTAPVPEGLNTRSSLDLLALISLPLIVMALLNNGDAYISVKLSLTLSIATRKVSPVPSFAFDPMFSVCCAILLYLYYPSNHCNLVVVQVIYLTP